MSTLQPPDPFRTPELTGAAAPVPTTPVPPAPRGYAAPSPSQPAAGPSPFPPPAGSASLPYAGPPAGPAGWAPGRSAAGGSAPGYRAPAAWAPADPAGWAPTAPAPRPVAPAWATWTALALSAVALVLGALGFLGPLLSGAFGAGPGAWEITGEVPSVTAGSPVFGPAIATAVSEALSEDGAEVETVTCGSVATLTRDATVTCRGTVDGFSDWSAFVRFTGEDGRFLVVEY